MPPKKRTWIERVVDNGLTLPGYNYLGPFNAEFNGLPRNPSDQAAQEHDAGYKKLRASGLNPYLSYNDADEDASTKWQSDYGGRIAKWVFSKKKQLADLNWIKTIKNGEYQSKPSLRGVKRPVPNEFSGVQDARKRFREVLGQSERSRSTSLLNSPSGGDMAGDPAGGGSGNAAGLRETQVDDVWNVTRGPPNYTFASLPWLRTFYVKTFLHTWMAAYRLTSPYDPEQTMTTADTNAGTGTQTERYPTVDTNPIPARWYNWYSSQYKYYHNVATRYYITIENFSMTPCWVHIMYRNDENIPQGATNEDIRLWPGTKSYFLGPAGYAITSSGWAESNQMGLNGMSATVIQDEKMDTSTTQTPNYETSNHISGGASNIVKINGEYRPGDYNRDIRLDSEVENWTLYNTNPALPERLFIVIRPDSDATVVSSSASQDVPINVKVSLELDYLTEFKELQTGIKFPLSRQPLIATIQDTRSAGANDETALP